MPAICARLGIACGLGAVLAAGPAGAQGLNGFLPEPGTATVALSHTMESYDEFWVGKKAVTDPLLAKIQTATLSLWVDVGLASNVALTAQLAYEDVNSDGPLGATATGMADRSVMLRWRFLNAEAGGYRHTLVAAAGIRDPASDYDPNRSIALGDGSRDGLFRLVYQIQADFLHGAWFASELGFDRRGEGVPNGYLLDGELGATLGRASLSACVMKVFADGGWDLQDPGFTYQGLDEELVRVEGKAYARVSDTVGIAVSMFTTPDGRNTGKSTGTSTSLVFRM